MGVSPEMEEVMQKTDINGSGSARYVPVRTKLILAQVMAFAWAALSWYLALPWVDDLSQHIPYLAASLIILGIAIIPGFAFAFILFSLAFDRRPETNGIKRYPPLTVLVAAYNERDDIANTLGSFAMQHYSGEIEIIVIDDGSTDDTASIVGRYKLPALRLIRVAKNAGKANALNTGLAQAKHDLIVTVDADSTLRPNALENIVKRFLSDPPGTVAVAGAVLARNSRANWLTSIQEWDYFHGIAIVKRTQSLYQGTLVAQGAFSLYTKKILLEVGGWPNTVGEDIVITWDMLKRGHRVGYAENAVVFTGVPATYQQFYQQRRRWARGLIEAFKHHPDILSKFRLNSTFYYLNLFYPFIDSVYLFCFLPGVVAAFFGYYFIAGPMTLAVLPMGIAMNVLMYKVQKGMFDGQGLRVRRNLFGFLGYVLFAQVILAPAAVAGYAAELANLRKTWGTK